MNRENRSSEGLASRIIRDKMLESIMRPSEEEKYRKENKVLTILGTLAAIIAAIAAMSQPYYTMQGWFK